MRRFVRPVLNLLNPPDPTRTRYFIVSPYKTATTTVGSALVMLGAGRREMRFRKGVLNAHRRGIIRLEATIPDEASAADWISQNADKARETLEPLMQPLLRFDVFSDVPFGHGNVHCFLLKAALPPARFIWVDRPLYEWLDSVRAWECSHPETYPDYDEWEDNPSYRRRRLRRKRDALYENFTRLAEDYPEDCLELSMDDLQSWDKLAAFCGRPTRSGPLPVRNVNTADIE